MKVIWKFRLEVTDAQEIDMPVGARVLSVHVDHNDVLQIWAVCDSEARTEPHKFAIVGTGNPMPGNLGRFIGTVLMPPFVWHVYEAV